MAVVILLGVLLAFMPIIGFAQDDANPLKSFLGTKIYTASKKNEDPYTAASSIFVVTQDDIKALNVTHFADALRLVPGLHVAKMSSNKWMIASRGFGEQFSNKLLVLIDGRPIYNTLFSGVLWDLSGIPLNNIKQIEVIRGTGATLWGSNAVNGVINVITKQADHHDPNMLETTLSYSEFGELAPGLEFAVSDDVSGKGSIRYSGSLRRNGSYETSTDSSYTDQWNSGTFNIRYDANPNEKQAFNLQTGLSFVDADQTYQYPSLSAPYSKDVDEQETSKQVYFKTEYIRSLGPQREVAVSSFLDFTDWYLAGGNAQFMNGGVEAQYRFPLFDKYESVTGVSYKATLDQIDGSSQLTYDPDHYDAHFLDAFMQTDIPLYKDSVVATLGGKVESNSYERFAFSPNAKLRFHPSRFTMFWVSASRAHRIPSRGTYHLTTRVNGTPGGYIALIPDEEHKSETVTTVDFGVRFNPLKGLHLEGSAFYSDYENLRTFLPDFTTSYAPDIFLPLKISNSGKGVVKGIELSAKYQTSPKYRWQFGYSIHELDFATDAGARDTVFLSSEEKWPQQSANALFTYSPASNLHFSAFLNYVDSVPSINVPDYIKGDLNLFWEIEDGIELSLGGHNLFDSRRSEYSAPLFGKQVDVPRYYQARLKLLF